MSEKNQTSHAKKAAALSIVPGVGQFYNHQKIVALYQQINKELCE